MICGANIVKNIINSVALLLFISNLLTAGTTSPHCTTGNGLAMPPDTTDTLIVGKNMVIQSRTITHLVQSHIDHNAVTKTGDGYRIQIFSETGDDAQTLAKTAKADFEKKYPAIVTYLAYAQPHFKVKVGNYPTRFEARQDLIRILQDYPEAILVKEKIAR